MHPVYCITEDVASARNRNFYILIVLIILLAILQVSYKVSPTIAMPSDEICFTGANISDSDEEVCHDF